MAWLLGPLRLVTGLVLVTFLTTHLAHHALGLVSLSAMEAGRGWFLALWRSPLGTAMLHAALVTHFGLALAALYRRRTLRMPPWEWVRLVFGLSIPFLLAGHVSGTRLASAWSGSEDSYTRMELIYWQARPDITAVGDTVRVASRVQDLTKDYDCQLVISEQVAALARLDVRALPRHQIEVRNRRQPLAIRVVDDLRRLGA